MCWLARGIAEGCAAWAKDRKGGREGKHRKGKGKGGREGRREEKGLVISHLVSFL